MTTKQVERKTTLVRIPKASNQILNGIKSRSGIDKIELVEQAVNDLHAKVEKAGKIVKKVRK